ncbi:MAG TPA: CocE/NonD family hydrolase [Verrucomicrobiae bacterium]|nr:CocE/NonD family hydrolase [Verrucomicrobiae bacterium]
MIARAFWVLATAFSLAGVSRAEVSPGEQKSFREIGWEKLEAMVRARDGVHLYTEIFRPLDRREKLPILLTRTPYNASVTFTAFTNQLNGALKELAAGGFIFARQDVRGKFKSEGAFTMLHVPLKEGQAGTDEGTDTYDTIEWMLTNVPENSGRVGLHGTSYLGWTTVMGTLRPHPALGAAVEEASPADMFLGDDFHHNGAFRLSYAYEYAILLESAKTNVRVNLDRYDSYEWYLKLGALSNVRKLPTGQLPTWKDYVAHPNYDEFWQRQAVAPYLTRVNVPFMHVAGWWDQEDFYGPLTIYRMLEKVDRDGRNFFVAGPWNHGGWNQAVGRKLGTVDFENDTATFYRRQIKAKFFAKFLKDRKETIPEATTFQTGANKWEMLDAWPPKDVRRQKLYLHAGRKLSFDAPTESSKKAADAFLSDPQTPVPYRPRPIEVTYSEGSRWSTWLTEDQRFVENRADVLTYATDALEKDLVVTGEIFANLFASTTGTDADWIVKLIDVYPEKNDEDPKMGGYRLMVANEVFRGRFRESFENPKAIQKNKPLEYRFSLHDVNHRFLKGHKIMVQIQSTWFPLIDRNPQKFVSNIFEAKDSDFVSATHRVHRSAKLATHVELPVRER